MAPYKFSEDFIMFFPYVLPSSTAFNFVKSSNSNSLDLEPGNEKYRSQRVVLVNKLWGVGALALRYYTSDRKNQYNNTK